MKKIMILIAALVLGFCVSQVNAQGISVLVHDDVQVPGTVRVIPPGQIYYVAPQYIAPRVIAPPTISPKPIFRTPVRNGMWYAGVGIKRGLWYNRYWRYNRLGRKLGPTVIVQTNNPYQP